MFSFSCATKRGWMAWLLILFAGHALAVDLAAIPRTIGREPEYRSKPHYALVVFGENAEHRSWLVMDGTDVLYFDRDGDGDLTDPEDKVELDQEASANFKMAKEQGYSGMNVFPIGEVAGTKLSLHFWVRVEGAVAQDERDRKIQKERAANDWENASLMRIAADGRAVQNGQILSPSPEKAQVTHLNGPLTFELKWGPGQQLETWPKPSVFDVHVGTKCLAAENFKYEVFAPLTEYEPPRDRHPTAVFTFANKDPKGKPIVEIVELDKRCCGDTLYAEMVIPRDAASGKAQVRLSYDAWNDRAVEPAEFEVAVNAEPTERTEACYILYSEPEIPADLQAAMGVMKRNGMEGFETALRPLGLPVSLSADGLILGEEGRQRFSVRLMDSKVSHPIIEALGSDTEYESRIGKTNTIAVIGFSSGDGQFKVPDQLRQIEQALLKITGGVAYHTWDQTFHTAEASP
ncbi:hypothetical protein [Aeoliella sp. SH292]|uniref:hypothetical protein n=1 Tax=Aeoliella sp. SH292 TaxID=3454464 RepID=UPI003F9C8D24